MTLTFEQKRTLYNECKYVVDAPTNKDGWFEEWNHDDWIQHIDAHGKWLYSGAVKPFGYNPDIALQAVRYIVQTVFDNDAKFIADVLDIGSADKEIDDSLFSLASFHISSGEAIAIVDDYTRGYIQRTCFVSIQDVLEFVEGVGNE